MIHIVTDSTADLSAELVERFNLRVIPFTVNLKTRSYQDGLTIRTPQLFALVEQEHELPKTAAPSLALYDELFSLPGDVIYIGMSSELSAAFQNATVAAQPYGGKVRLINSLNLSTGVGMLAVMAAELRDQGCGADEIAAALRQAIPRVRTSFVIDTLDYLYMGGRCTAMQSIVSSILKIRPVIEVRADGTLGIKDKTRGSRKKALAAMLESFARDLPNIDLHRVFITHTVCLTDAEFLNAELLKLCAPDEICITDAGSVVASHCGPNTIGILYLVKA